MRDSGGGDSWSANTNFEQFTHADLLKMMAGANPAAVTKVGTTLAEASTHMQSLADDLATHINGLVWDGDAGDAFKTWARQVVSATDTLAIFTSNTAVGINMAGETLSSTQVPPIPAADQATVDAYKKQFGAQTFIGTDGEAKVAKPLFSTNPTLNSGTVSPAISHLVSQETAYQAQTRLDAAHQEAIGQMEKLGGAYVGAQSTLTVSTIPTFPPTPAALMPPPGSGYTASTSNLGEVSKGSTSSGVTGGVATTVSGTKSTKKTTSGSSSGEDPAPSTFEPVTSPGSSSGTGTGGGSTGGSGSTTLQGVGDPNNPSGSGGTNTGGGGGTTGGSSSNGGTGGGNGSVIAPPPGGVNGGTNNGSQGPGGVTSGGTEPGGSSSTGIGGGNSRTGGVTGEPETGIHGGVPTPVSARSTSRSGSGVIGAEGDGAGMSASALGRGRIGGGSVGVEGAATGGAASMAESAGSSTARSGLGSSAAGEGAAAAAAEGHGSGMMPMGGGGMGGAAGGKGRRRQRAAYLTEDEETWAQDVPANPTVIQ